MKRYLLVVFLMAFGAAVQGQTAGKLIGQVNDASQAAVPDAKVKAENIATSQVRESTTDGRGIYSINDLPIGHYKVTVEHTGFSTAAQNDIQITVAQTATLNFSLQTGTLNQVVEVSSKAEAVDVQPGETLTKHNPRLQAGGLTRARRIEFD